MLDVFASTTATGAEAADSGAHEAAQKEGQPGAGANLRVGYGDNLHVAVGTKGENWIFAKLDNAHASLWCAHCVARLMLEYVIRRKGALLLSLIVIHLIRLEFSARSLCPQRVL